MSNNSKAKAILDFLMTDVSRYMGWDEIMEGLITGFSMVPRRMQRETIEIYMTYLPHVYAEADHRKVFVLRDGVALKAKFKIATDAPADQPEIKSRLIVLTKRANGISNRVEVRIENLKEAKILPNSWSPAIAE